MVRSYYLSHKSGVEIILVKLKKLTKELLGSKKDIAKHKNVT